MSLYESCELLFSQFILLSIILINDLFRFQPGVKFPLNPGDHLVLSMIINRNMCKAVSTNKRPRLDLYWPMRDQSWSQRGEPGQPGPVRMRPPRLYVMAATGLTLHAVLVTNSSGWYSAFFFKHLWWQRFCSTEYVFTLFYLWKLCNFRRLLIIIVVQKTNHLTSQ